MKPPIYSILTKYISKQRIKFCTPGHKGKIRMKTDNLCRIDIESIPKSDSESDIRQCILKSEEEIAGVFGSSKSFYLNGGISGGVYAALASVCSPGDKVIIDPECDKSVINAITILALQPVFLKRSYCKKYSLNGGISTKEAEYAIESTHDAKLIILTSPTYYGVCANIKKIASIARSYNMLVMVDESHGVHMNFAENSPKTALECGADIVVQSLSKTMGGFVGSGLLHIAETIDKNTLSTIEANLDVYQGGCNSTAMLCASENVLNYAFTNAGKYYSLYREIERGKHIISEKTDFMWFDAEFDNGCDINYTDKTKIVLNFSNVTMTAVEAAEILLTRYGIEADYSDDENIVFSVSLYNTPSEIRKLINSCLNISRLTEVSEPDETDEFTEFPAELFDEGPKAVMSPYKAFYCSGEWVPIDDGIGKICRKPICKMPQGTPIIIPGEKITAGKAHTIKTLLSHGVKIDGLNEFGLIEVLGLSDSFYF